MVYAFVFCYQDTSKFDVGDGGSMGAPNRDGVDEPDEIIGLLDLLKTRSTDEYSKAQGEDEIADHDGNDNGLFIFKSCACNINRVKL